jgi:hypothetical protein
MREPAVERNLLPIRVREENVMVSSPRADRYWKSGSGGTVAEGCGDRGKA